MVATLAAAMLVALTSQRQTDTTFAVPAGASLSVNNFGGGITIHGWSENRVKVHAEQGRRGRVEVSLVGNTVKIGGGEIVIATGKGASVRLVGNKVAITGLIT